MAHSPQSLLSVLCLFLTLACEDKPRTSGVPSESYSVDRLVEADSVDIIRDIRVDESGRVWILAASPPFVTVVDSTGKVLKAGGRRGRGPSDFLYPYAFLTQAPSGEAPVVIDLGRHQLVQVDTNLNGAEATDLRLLSGVMRADMPKIVPSLPLAVSTAESTVLAIVLTKNVSNESDLASQSVVRFSTRSTDTLWTQRALKESQLRWLRAYSLWDSCGESGLLGVDISGRWLRRVHFDGKVDSSRIPLPSFRRKVEQVDIRRHARFRAELEFRENGSVPTPRQLDEAVEFAGKAVIPGDHDSLPAYASIKCVSADEYWLQRFDLEQSGNGSSRTWYRIRGGIATLITLPTGFRPSKFGSNSILGLMLDDDDIARIATSSRRR